MALPAIGLALRAVGAFGRARKDATAGVGQVKLKVSLAQGGRGLRRSQRRMTAATQRAAIAASNDVGRKIYAELVEAMSVEAKASSAAVKRTLIRTAASRRQKRKIEYRIKVRPGRAGQIPVKALKTKFRPVKKGSTRGALTFDQLGGEEVTFASVDRFGSGRGAGYGFARTSKLKARAVGGVRFKFRQTPRIERVRKRIKPEFRRAFRARKRAMKNKL